MFFSVRQSKPLGNTSSLDSAQSPPRSRSFLQRLKKFGELNNCPPPAEHKNILASNQYLPENASPANNDNLKDKWVLLAESGNSTQRSSLDSQENWSDVDSDLYSDSDSLQSLQSEVASEYEASEYKKTTDSTVLNWSLEKCLPHTD